MHKVKCLICGQTFDRDKEETVSVGRRYCHKLCSLSNDLIKEQELKDKENLEKYIKELFDYDIIPAKVRKQIASYMKDYNYTYGGILKSLKYFYEVRGNTIEKSNGGIGIVPWVYNDAYNYYYELWLAQQRNVDKKIEAYVPQTIEIKIKRPRVKIKKSKKFSFLEEEENNNGF